MKRSKMQEELALYLRSITNDSMESRLHMADRLITKIEELGMRPPASFNINSKDDQGLVYVNYTHKWEEE